MSVSFEELGATAPTIKALSARRIESPFPIQVLALPPALEGKDILAKSRTGSGKTLAFAIPIVERLDPNAKGVRAMVLVPTRELAVQVRDEFSAIAQARNLKVAAVYGGAGIGEQAKKASRASIIVATPGRLEDLCNRRMVDLSKVSILVLDEADRMLDMGFQPQVDRLVRRIPRERQTMFFSATLDGEVGRMASAYTTSPVTVEVATDRPTLEEIEHRFIAVDDTRKLQMLVDMLVEQRGLALVFVKTKRGVDRLATKLRAAGVSTVAMHGDMTQAARERSLTRFDSGKASTLVATDVAARGLDVDNITHVINYDPPEDHKAYLHRVGRTARAGKTGVGITFVRPTDSADMGRMASRLELHNEFAESGLKILPPQIAYSSHRGRGRKGSMMGRRTRRR